MDQGPVRRGPKTFPAAFDGRCWGCGSHIIEGDAIGYVEDEICCETCIYEDYDG